MIQFEQRKQEWRDELDTMSEFLMLKSTEEQKEEGCDQPVDTAYIDDREGMPVLKVGAMATYRLCHSMYTVPNCHHL